LEHQTVISSARPLEPPDGARKLADDALEIGEDAVAPLGVELIDRFLEEPLIVHVAFPVLRGIIIIGPFVVHRACFGQNATPHACS